MKKLIAFWSPTGAGATTTLLNTAVAAGARGVRLAAADLNLTAPSLALYADLLPHDRPDSACFSRLLPALQGGRLTAEDLRQAMLPGPGFLLLPGMLDVLGASRLTEEEIMSVVRLLRSTYDLLLVDVAAPLDSIACFPVLEQADLICLVVGPDLASRFHTRRYALPLIGLGWQAKTLLIYNRAGATPAAQVAEEIGLPVAVRIPELKQMDALVSAGTPAYNPRAVVKATAAYRGAIENLAALLLKGE